MHQMNKIVHTETIRRMNIKKLIRALFNRSSFDAKATTVLEANIQKRLITTTQYSSFHRHIQNEMLIIGLISVINLLPHDSDDTSRLCCAKATLSPPGWRRAAWHRSVNLIKLFVEWFSCCLVSDDLTSDSNGIRNAVQLRVFIYKPPSHGVQEQRFSLAFSQLTF